MPANGNRRKVSQEKVLAYLATMSDAQLERLLPQVFALRTRRGRHVLSAREAQLLEQINGGLPDRLQGEFNRLIEKRRAGTITEAQARQLHRLTDKAELFDARRLRCLVELAGLRKTTLDKLMRSLGLKTPAYA